MVILTREAEPQSGGSPPFPLLVEEGAVVRIQFPGFLLGDIRIADHSQGPALNIYGHMLPAALPCEDQSH